MAYIIDSQTLFSIFHLFPLGDVATEITVGWRK